MHTIKITTILVFCISFFLACNSESQNKSQNNGDGDKQGIMLAPPLSDKDEHEVVAQETINTNNYTYIRALKGNNEYWIAVPRQEVKVGNTYFFSDNLMMEKFHSPELNRDFEVVYFVSTLYTKKGNPESTNPTTTMTPEESAEPVGEAVQVTHAQGAVKLSDLLAAPEKYKGKTVKVTGKCVKFNSGIMGRNWVHIQDGTAGNPDLTITTDETVEVGKVVTFEGVLALKKDFGAGYSYPVILEKAVLK